MTKQKDNSPDTAAKNNGDEPSDKNPATPKPVPQKTKEKVESAQPEKQKQRSIGPVFIIVIVLIGVAAYLSWQLLYLPLHALQADNDQLRRNIETAAQTNQSELASVATQWSNSVGAATAKIQKLADTTADLSAQNAEIRKTLQAMQQYQSLDHADWMLNEAEHLLLIANHRLQLAHDTDTALVALQYADETLRNLNDPALTPVRKVLAEEILALSSHAKLDITGLSLQLESISQKVMTLPLAADQKRDFALSSQHSSDSGTEQAPTVSSWLQSVWSDIRLLFSLRRIDTPVVPLIPPEQRFFLSENLRLVIQAMQLSLLRRDQVAFEANLNKATAWVKNYFDTSSTETQAILQQLNKLKAVSVETNLPDISGSIQALRNYQTQSNTQFEAAQ